MMPYIFRWKQLESWDKNILKLLYLKKYDD